MAPEMISCRNENQWSVLGEEEWRRTRGGENNERGITRKELVRSLAESREMRVFFFPLVGSRGLAARSRTLDTSSNVREREL